MKISQINVPCDQRERMQEYQVHKSQGVSESFTDVKVRKISCYVQHKLQYVESCKNI